MQFSLFGSTKICLACGSQHLYRRFRDRQRVDVESLSTVESLSGTPTIPAHLEAICSECGWKALELLKGTSA
jgi:hypothetical protein